MKDQREAPLATRPDQTALLVSFTRTYTAAASSSADAAQHVNFTSPPAPLLATMIFGTAVTMPHGTEPDPRRLDMPRLNHFWRPFWKPKALTAIVRETLPSTLHL